MMNKLYEEHVKYITILICKYIRNREIFPFLKMYGYPKDNFTQTALFIFKPRYIFTTL